MGGSSSYLYFTKLTVFLIWIRCSSTFDSHILFYLIYLVLIGFRRLVLNKLDLVEVVSTYTNLTEVYYPVVPFSNSRVPLPLISFVPEIPFQLVVAVPSGQYLPFRYLSPSLNGSPK